MACFCDIEGKVLVIFHREPLDATTSEGGRGEALRLLSQYPSAVSASVSGDERLCTLRKDEGA